MAVLRIGFSEKWGKTAISDNQNPDSFIAGLSERKKKLYEKEVRSLLDEGSQLARKTIIANYDQIFMPVASHLAANGEVLGPVLERFYQQRKNLIVHPDDMQTVAERVRDFEAKIKAESPPVNKRDFEFYSFVQKPKTVVDVDALRKQRREKELASVDLSPGKVVVEKKMNYAPAKTEIPVAALLKRASVGRCERVHH
jgi:hypothetical protein